MKRKNHSNFGDPIVIKSTTDEMLREVSIKVALQSFVLSREQSRLNSADIFNIVADMETQIATLLVVANKLKREAA